MNATLGIDVGTYESKGVLVDADGHVLASAARPHELIVPRAGWAESIAPSKIGGATSSGSVESFLPIAALTRPR
jgi:glycerol kinase